MSNVTFEITVVLLLILLNGLFAMAEIAVVSARRVRLQQMAVRGDKGAQVALQLAEAPNRFLSTVQVGITLVGILAGAFGGARIAQPLGDWLAQAPWLGRYADEISLFLVVGLITFFSVVIGELVPKRIALGSAEQIAARLARPMNSLSVIATPIVRLLSLATDGVLKLLGIQASSEAAVTEEEIRILVEQGARAGIIEAAERDMVESVFRLNDRPLEAMMTPRPEIVWLDINAPDEVNRRILEEEPFSRYPVCDGGLDNVLGIVRAKDLLASCMERGPSAEPLDLRAALLEPLYFPETMRALRVLEPFKQSGNHLAFVVDEYGGIDGVVTLIDILEAIVGDIPTEDEIVEPPVVQRDDGSWLIDGLLTLDEFEALFPVQRFPDEGTYQTLGGFVVYMVGRLPVTGDGFEWAGYRFEVVDMDGHRVDKVLLESLEEEEEAEP
ncbi:MAG: hemolysin family protein [Anaerolineae bacterium]|nr:hemolysin family protein [Anaerolineae bacterium]